MDENVALKLAELITQGLDSRIDSLETNLGKQLAEIRRQTTKTNGRVTRLEVWRESIASTRSARTETRRFRLSTAAVWIAGIATSAEALHLFLG